MAWAVSVASDRAASTAVARLDVQYTCACPHVQINQSINQSITNTFVWVNQRYRNCAEMQTILKSILSVTVLKCKCLKKLSYHTSYLCLMIARACTVAQAVVQATGQSNGKGRHSTLTTPKCLNCFWRNLKGAIQIRYYYYYYFFFFMPWYLVPRDLEN